MNYPKQESATVELKEALPKNDQIIKTIIGFCNQNGGKLIVGVKNNGRIIGVPESEINQALEYLEKSIYEASAPPIIPQVYAQRIGDAILLIIEVSSGMNKPYYLKSEGLDRGAYIRVGRSTVRATPDMIEELKWQSRGKSYDATPAYHATLRDLNMKRVDDFLTRLGKKQANARDTLMQSYYIVADEHAHHYPTVAGLLTFGNDPQKFLPQAFIICTHFSGISGRTALATRDCTGTLMEQFAQASDFIESRLNKSFVIKKRKREDTLEIPPEALREMLVNAIAHRNYHIQAPIKIAIFENRVEIFSPGNFPGPLVQENLCAGLTYIRNIALAKILRRSGLVESLGTGFRTLFESYEKANLPTPQVVEGEGFVKVILPRKPLHPTRTTKRKELPDRFESQILNLLSLADTITMADIIKQTGLTRATAGRKISQLVKEKSLKKRGVGRNTQYSAQSTHAPTKKGVSLNSRTCKYRKIFV